MSKPQVSYPINYLNVFLNQLDDFLGYLHLNLKIHDAGVVRQGVLTMRKMNPRLVLTEFMDFAVESDPDTNVPYYQTIIRRDESFFLKQSKEDLQKRIGGDNEEDKNSNILKALELRKRWNTLAPPIKDKIFKTLARLVKLGALSNKTHYSDVLEFIESYLREIKEQEDLKHELRKQKIQV